jgi:cellulose synthase/poly-beta-1,6-N-acetylglucosamine synthase-like glycosyltransferase
MTEATTEAVVVVDADTDVSRNLLIAMASRLRRGEQVMQAHYGVRNVEDSWRTRLIDVAFTLYHGVRSSARERLALSTGLRGNGMGFAMAALRQVPYEAYSLVEDVEYGVELGLRGIRVSYLDDAAVYGEMVAGEKASQSQRKRWEQGRRAMVSRYVPKLLSQALRQGKLMPLDLAFDLLTPPLTTVALYTAAGGCLSLGCVVVGLANPVVLLPWGAAGLGLAAYLLAGIRLSPHGLQSIKDLSHAPRYALWKLTLKLRKQDPQDQAWVRTQRNGEVP